MLKLGISILFCSALFHTAHAEQPAIDPINESATTTTEAPKETEASTEPKEYIFKSTPASKKDKIKIVGRLYFSEVSGSVRLNFNGTNLQKGFYKIFKIDDCEAYKKNKNKSSAGEEIFAFETKYGEISDEKNLSVTSVNDLHLQDKAFALVKTAGKALTFISCSAK